MPYYQAIYSGHTVSTCLDVSYVGEDLLLQTSLRTTYSFRRTRLSKHGPQRDTVTDDARYTL